MLVRPLEISRRARFVHPGLREALQQATVQCREHFRFLEGRYPVRRGAREPVEARRGRPAPFGAPCAQKCVAT